MAFTVRDVCEACQCSRAWLYGEWAAGRGPSYFMLGSRRRVLKGDLETWLQSLRAGREVSDGRRLIEGGVINARTTNGPASEQIRDAEDAHSWAEKALARIERLEATKLMTRQQKGRVN
jgi:hypothetical protein